MGRIIVPGRNNTPGGGPLIVIPGREDMMLVAPVVGPPAIPKISRQQARRQELKHELKIISQTVGTQGGDGKSRKRRRRVARMRAKLARDMRLP